MTQKQAKEDIELPLLSGGFKQSQEPSQPESKAKYLNTGFFDSAFFGWATAIIKNSKTHTFEQDQHIGLRNQEEAEWIAKRYWEEWDKAEGERFRLFKTKYRVFKPLVIQNILISLFITCVDYCGPILISKIITYVQLNRNDRYEGFLLVAVFLLVRFTLIFSNAHYAIQLNLLNKKMLIGTVCLIYRKSLNFPLMRNKDFASGSIMNLMLVDAEAVSKIFFLLPLVLTFPLMIIFGIYLLYTEVGAAFIGGIFVVIGVVTFTSKVTAKTAEYQKKAMEAKDVRMKKTTEIFSGIKYIKMCGIEEKFLESVDKDREDELIWIRAKNILTAVRMVFFWVVLPSLTIAIFGCYILFNGELTPQKAFVVITTISIMQPAMNWIGQVMSELIQGKVSLERIEKLLFAEEMDYSYIQKGSKDNTSDSAIKIKNGNFYWEEASDKFRPSMILKNINMNIKKGTFVAVLGDVGSGKSSLFNCMFGEMLADKSASPRIELNGSVSYVSQKPWIINAKIKDNITLGFHLESNKYKEALRTSCLESDLKALIAKDETEIGEKGVNLSGGQKARVALARAIYANSDIYLLDDPLSAVDAHVGKYILEECLIKQLKDKTRVLITHKVESLKYVDYIYIMKGGEIVSEGDFDQIKQTPYYQEIEQNSRKNENNQDEEGAETDQQEEVIEKDGSRRNTSKRQSKMTIKSEDKKKESSIHEDAEQKQIMEKLMLNEDRQVGAVSLDMWVSYFKYLGSTKFFCLLMGSVTIWGLLKTSGDFWLAHWSNSVAQGKANGSNLYYYGVYATLTLSSALFMLVRMGLVTIGGIKMSRSLHGDMFSKVIRAPVNLFFDRVPQGRLINRFASDLDVIDSHIPFNLSRLAFIPIDMVCKIFVACYAGTIWILPLVFVFAYIGFNLQQAYLRVYREAFRLSRITASPIISMVAESLDGLTQIRSSDYQNVFLQKFFTRRNENTKNLIVVEGVSAWFQFYINLSSLLVVAPTITMAILFNSGNNDNAALVGLLILSLLDFSHIMIFFLSTFSIFESNLISFERCKAFTKVETEREPRTKLPLANFSQNWPDNGEITFRNYYAKYRPTLPYVLKDVSFRISPGEKVGVVGRTGSGKSTTLLSLLRIIESNLGEVQIDNVNISKVGLDDLRNKITIIPQDPLLYKGSLRSNLDLFDQYSDYQIWEALEKTCMKKKFVETGLETEIKAGGENLSAGEKQLLCIARAILSKNKIILVDEATSSIDNVTEEAILEAIRQNFQDCTMITIAHRLKTIINSDKILFMDQGRVMEFDTPKNLLDNKKGHFYGLWKEYEDTHN